MKKYILDTHVAIWAVGDKVKLSNTAKSIIDDVTIPLCVSITSAWEIAIKISRGKLSFCGGSSSFLSHMRNNGIEIIGVEGVYIEKLESLPFIHKDPFDRLIISTVIEEGLTLITADEDIQKYDIPWIW